MKKICMVFNHFQLSDGVTKTAIGMANYLAEECDVQVCMKPLFIFDPKVKEALHPDVEVKPVFGFYFRGFARIVDLIPAKILYRMVIREKYDIEIAFQRILGAKMVAHSENKDARHIMWMHIFVDGLPEKKYYLKADQMVTVSQCHAEMLREHLGDSVPVDCCYNLIDDEKIRNQGQEKGNLPPRKGLVFVTVGRFCKQKGFDRLLDCVSRLKKEGYLFSLWLIGKGEEDSALRQKAKDLDVEDIVYFTGEQKNPHRFTANADLFVCSSLYEGYSTACTEAVILGTPVLTTDVSGGKEIIDTADAGMLVGLEDEDLYLGMKTILDNPEIVAQWKETLNKTKTRFFQNVRKEKIRKLLNVSLKKEKDRDNG